MATDRSGLDLLGVSRAEAKSSSSEISTEIASVECHVPGFYVVSMSASPDTFLNDKRSLLYGSHSRLRWLGAPHPKCSDTKVQYIIITTTTTTGSRVSKLWRTYIASDMWEGSARDEFSKSILCRLIRNYSCNVKYSNVTRSGKGGGVDG